MSSPQKNNKKIKKTMKKDCQDVSNIIKGALQRDYTFNLVSAWPLEAVSVSYRTGRWP